MPLLMAETSDVSEAERQSWIVEQARKKEQAQELKRQQSEAFYTSIGHPELAGKYEPFPIPFGSQVQEVKETPSGLEVTFKPPPEPAKGIAETLAGFTTKPLLSYIGIKPLPKTPTEIVYPRETVRPFAGIAGVIAEVEAPVYTIAQLTGISTPRVPPYTMEYGPEYMAGRITGTIIVSIGIGKAVGKVWELTPKVIKTPIGKIAGAVAKPFRPITEPITSKLEKLALWPHERIAPGIVSIPTLERVGLKGVEAQVTAWELAEAPKTSAYLISKMPAEPLAKAWATEHLLKTVTGGLSYALVSEQLRATTIQKMPYTPTMFETGVSSAVAVQALGVGIALLPKALPRETVKPKLEIVPSLKPKIFEEPFEIQKLKLFPQAYPRQRQRERAIPILTSVIGLKPLTETISVLKLETPQMTKQMQRQALAMPSPLLQRQITTTTTFPRLPRFEFQLGKLSKKQQESLFGKWFYRRHPIVKPSQVMRSFVGFPTRRRRR